MKNGEIPHITEEEQVTHEECYNLLSSGKLKGIMPVLMNFNRRKLDGIEDDHILDYCAEMASRQLRLITKIDSQVESEDGVDKKKIKREQAANEKNDF